MGLLPHYPEDDITHFMVLNLLVAGWVRAEPVAVASRPGLPNGMERVTGSNLCSSTSFYVRFVWLLSE